MAIVEVPKTDNFEQWRVKTNQISTNVGDLDNLQTQDTTNIVNAVNSAQNFSVAMAIALG